MPVSLSELTSGRRKRGRLLRPDCPLFSAKLLLLLLHLLSPSLLLPHLSHPTTADSLSLTTAALNQLLFFPRASQRSQPSCTCISPHSFRKISRLRRSSRCGSSIRHYPPPDSPAWPTLPWARRQASQRHPPDFLLYRSPIRDDTASGIWPFSPASVPLTHATDVPGRHPERLVCGCAVNITAVTYPECRHARFHPPPRANQPYTTSTATDVRLYNTADASVRFNSSTRFAAST